GKSFVPNLDGFASAISGVQESGYVKIPPPIPGSLPLNPHCIEGKRGEIYTIKNYNYQLILIF
ncbi:hypothetical protein, partial [Megasphaera elsdenii]|uniref:hypothetical protein n=1 Tax=Megasphaera elsdenii TaxID=907 RepID=UPI002E7A7652